MKLKDNEVITKPKILPLPNGPLYLINDTNPKVIDNLQNSEEKTLSTTIGIALCRCGASKNKPFCDGSHSVIGFLSNNSDIKKDNHRKDYVGRNIIIHDNRSICSHAAECVENLASVFRLKERPWISPDGGSVQDIIDTVKKCPSGALSYSIGETEYRDQDRKPMITVSKDGPYKIEGAIELIGVTFSNNASREHYTLCRCGASNNKPFCDGTHNEIGFKDSTS